MRLADLFVSTAILDGGQAVGKDEVVGRLLTLLAQAGHVPQADLPAILAAVLRRERLGSTGIGRGLAIPHARYAVAGPLGVLAVCRPPVWFDALDGEPLDIVALLLSPPDLPGQHLGEASRWSEGLVRRLAGEVFCRRLRQARSAEDIVEVLLAEDGGMTRREWLACTDPAAMLRLLQDRGLLGERKARMFAAACCRRFWERLSAKGRLAVEATERYADGLAGRAEWDGVRRAFTVTLGEASGRYSFANAAVSYLLADAGTDPAGYALDLSPWAASAGQDSDVELAAQTDILRCLFGPPPFSTAAIKAEWLSFSDGVVPKLASGIYDDGALDHLPILADALEEAGCGDERILAHLRGPGRHVRGCFVLDQLLGKE